MATSVAETCQWLLGDKITIIHPSAFIGLLKTVYTYDLFTEHGTYKKQAYRSTAYIESEATITPYKLTVHVCPSVPGAQNVMILVHVLTKVNSFYLIDQHLPYI
jgi:hypothetical protein